jgi:hypothetical protein
METAIIAIMALLALGLWCDNWRLRRVQHIDEAKQALLQSSLDSIRREWEDEKEAAFTRGRASVIAREVVAKSPTFDKDDKIPTNGPRRYVPLAIRRAQAERASMGPQTHDAQVRENNAKAMGVAG